MQSKIQFKEIDGLIFYRKKYTDTWIISGIDICKELGYKNPYKQAEKIYSKYKENFEDTSYILKLPRSQKLIKGTPQIGGCLYNKNYQETRCYTRPGLWFFTSKCNIPKANKLIETLFKKFDKLISDLEQCKTAAWKTLRESGKLDRAIATDAINLMKEYAEDHGSKNGGRYFKIYTDLIQRVVSGLKKVPPNFRDIASPKELKEISILESMLKPWILQCIENNIDRHEIYKLIKKEISVRLPLIRQSMVRTLIF